MRNSLLLYTIIQINDTLLLYQLLFINAMKHQLTLARTQIFNLYTYTPGNLINVSSRGISLSRDSLDKDPDYQEILENFFLTFQLLVFNTLFVLVIPLQFPPTKKEAHQSPQMFILQHTTSSCWRLITFYHHPSLHWYWHPQ